MAKRPSNKIIIEAMDNSRGIISNIAKKLDVSRNTVYQWIDSDDELKEALKNANECLLDNAEDKLVNLVDQQDFRAISFILKTRGKDRGYVETMETKDVSDKPRVIQVLNEKDIENEEALE